MAKIPEEDFWTTREGLTLYIPTMESSHLSNCIKLLRRQCKENVGYILRNRTNVKNEVGDLTQAVNYTVNYYKGRMKSLLKESNKRNLNIGPE